MPAQLLGILLVLDKQINGVLPATTNPLYTGVASLTVRKLSSVDDEISTKYNMVLNIIMPRPHMAEALSDDERLTSVCLSRTLGLSRERRGLGRLKLAQR